MTLNASWRNSFLERNMIRFIMWLTDGPTDPDSNIEFTDWEHVDRFADAIAGLGSGCGAPEGRSASR